MLIPPEKSCDNAHSPGIVAAILHLICHLDDNYRHHGLYNENPACAVEKSPTHFTASSSDRFL